MSIFDIDAMNERSLIVHYILETRNRGHFLTYHDIEIVDSWLRAASNNVDMLLLILNEHLPAYYQRHLASSIPPSLKGLHNLVLKKIRNINK
jgi:hypothetical protein